MASMLAEIDSALYAAVRAGPALTLDQKRNFVHGAMVAGGEDWVRNTLRVPVNAVPLSHWGAGMIDKAFAAIRAVGRNEASPDSFTR